MEIERKYLITRPPADYTSYPCRLIEQGYLSTEPVVRIRREDDSFYLTCKSKGLLVREEYNFPLTPDSYEHLIKKADGHIITKRRYLIPLEGSEPLTIELDVFEGRLKGLLLAEVEFPDKEKAESFIPPSWFGEEVTFSQEYQNSRLSQLP